MCIEKGLLPAKYDFELEFCLTKESYKKAYQEDGSLWELRHEAHLKLFHELFRTEEGKKRIVDDIKVINLIFFKRRRSFFNAFSKAEFSEDELGFLRTFIFAKK